MNALVPKVLFRALRLNSSPNLFAKRRWIYSQITTVKFSNEEKRSFYEYTGGRWLWNESQQLSARRVEFNVDAIQRAACEAFGAASCVGFSKLDEGSYNKVFLLRFDDDREAIARIPTSLAGPPFLATASEVATMEFAHDVLKIPTPRVLAWSGKANAPNNPVGAEYIIMEKAPGTDLRARWPLITSGLDVVPLVNDFIDIENKFEKVTFSQIGSLYFKEDVSSELQLRPLFSPDVDLETDETIKVASEKYRIGPLTDRQWWRGGRADLDIDRGPWLEPLSYFTAAVQCELTFIQSPAASAVQFRQNPFVPLSLYKRILHLLLDVFPLIMPLQKELCAPTLWHPDLSEANILVAPTSGANITSVIDWQFAQIAPYFTHAVFPSMLLYTDDVLPVPPGLQFPKLPADYDSYSPEKQAYIRRHHRLIMRQKSYQAFRASRGTERRQAASKVPHAALLAMLPYYTLRAWSHGPHLLMDALGDIQELWTAIVSDDTIKCPMDDLSPDFEAELVENAQVFEALEYYDVSVTRMMKAVGCTGDGLVSYEDYEAAREECDRLRVLWDQQAEGKPFPFADGMFSFFLS